MAKKWYKDNIHMRGKEDRGQQQNREKGMRWKSKEFKRGKAPVLSAKDRKNRITEKDKAEADVGNFDNWLALNKNKDLAILGLYINIAVELKCIAAGKRDDFQDPYGATEDEVKAVVDCLTDGTGEVVMPVAAATSLGTGER